MNIVTGGLGFIGNELVRQLVRSGRPACVIDNRNRVAPRIDDLAGVQVIELDITDHDGLRSCFHELKVNTIFHLAAIHYIPECNENPERTLRVNVEGTQSVLRAAAAAGVRKVVFASSGAVYADSSEKLNESSLVGPVDIYGWSKLFGEKLCHFQHQESGLPIMIARLFNNYGPRETNPHIIPEILNQLRMGNELNLGKVTTVRDYIHTRDCARALIKLADHSFRGVETVNLGTGKGYTVLELIDRIAEMLDRKITVQHDSGRMRKFDKQTQVAEVGKLRSLTGWSPEYSVETGLEDLLRFEGLL